MPCCTDVTTYWPSKYWPAPCTVIGLPTEVFGYGIGTGPPGVGVLAICPVPALCVATKTPPVNCGSKAEGTAEATAVAVRQNSVAAMPDRPSGNSISRFRVSAFISLHPSERPQKIKFSTAVDQRKGQATGAFPISACALPPPLSRRDHCMRCGYTSASDQPAHARLWTPAVRAAQTCHCLS